MVALDEASPDAELRHGILIVSHDASRMGAPLTALNIARELVETRGIPVVTILLAPGELEPEFARMGPLFVARRRLTPAYYQLDRRPWARLVKRAIYLKEAAWHERFWRRIAKYLAKRQIRSAVCNTVLSGGAAIRLKYAGVASIGLIHELPHTIRTLRWTDQAAALTQGATALVFACPQVQAAFTGAFSTGGKPSYVYAEPQYQSGPASGGTAHRRPLGLSRSPRSHRRRYPDFKLW
jgi:O-antigen biosynthesis protein